MKPLETSKSMPLSVDFLTSALLQQPGQLGLTMAPGKKDEEAEISWNRNLQDDLVRLRDHYGVVRLVCLLAPEELDELEIPNLLTEAEAYGLIPEHLPIPDDGLPESLVAFSMLVNKLIQAVSSGETVLIHCKGGRGRTGMLAASCLVRLGFSPEEAISSVRQVRSGSLTSARQRDFVHNFHSLAE